jgi:thymidine kinase
VVNKGRIEVLAGPMFGGKTEELIRRVNRARIIRQTTQVFKPHLDTRYDATDIVSHNQSRLNAVTFDPKNPESLLRLVTPSTVVVGIDEVQWCSASIVPVCEGLARQGVRVILAGLDLDSSGRPFGSMPVLMAVAEETVKLSAICTVCGEPAYRTQRLVASTELVEVGGADKYAPRCRAHHSP